VPSQESVQGVSAADAAALASQARAPAPKGGRVALVDAARGGALVAMILFHFTWDLDFFGLVPSGTADSAWFRWLGHAIASTFLVIVGASLALAARRGFAPQAFLRRIATITAAALLITAATWIVFPNEYIFFGILHCIAATSLAAVLFLRAPAALTLALGVVALALPSVAGNPVFDAPAVQWLGLGVHEPITNDWAPFFPAFGFVLIGLAAARFALARGIADWLGLWRPRSLASRLLIVGGRRSLLIYLAHQPILLGVLFVAAAWAGHARPSEAASFVRSCSAQCVARADDQTFCARVCGCLADRTQSLPMWRDVLDNRLSPKERDSFNATARQCMRALGPPAAPSP
jgi:uncharacterized membrane protein